MRPLLGVMALCLMAGCKSEAVRQRELDTCKRIAEMRGGLADCLRNRYGWDEGEATDAMLDDLKSRYPKSGGR